MLLLKLLVATLGFAVVWLQIHLDYKTRWRDRRTRLHRFAFATLKFVVVPAAIALTLLVVALDHRSAEEAGSSLKRMEALLQQIATATGATSWSGDAILAAISDLRARVATQDSKLSAQGDDLRETQERLARQGATVSELRDAAAPRLLSPAASATLVKELSAAPGHVALLVAVNDPEASAFGQQLMASLTAGGWTVRRNAAMFDPPLRGLRLRVGVQRVPRGHPGHTLQRALSSAGFAVSLNLDTTLGPSEAVLSVGHK